MTAAGLQEASDEEVIKRYEEARYWAERYQPGHPANTAWARLMRERGMELGRRGITVRRIGELVR